MQTKTEEQHFILRSFHSYKGAVQIVSYFRNKRMLTVLSYDYCHDYLERQIPIKTRNSNVNKKKYHVLRTLHPQSSPPRKIE